MRPVARVAVLAVAALLWSAGLLAAHDMFLRPATHFVAANSTVVVRLFNGTYSKSENAIARDRLVNVAIVSPTGRAALDTAQWGVTGDTSKFTLTTGAPGTYVLGASTRPKVLGMAAKAFNAYLAEDGLPDELATRRKEGRLNDPSKERYHKHVKALVQVGDTPSATYATVLGYPAELVPLQNPYMLKVGGTLEVKALVDGKPVAGQFVQYGGRTAGDGRVAQLNTRTDASGIARIPLNRTGSYFIKFIHMRRISGDSMANYESRWTTLTFAMR